MKQTLYSSEQTCFTELVEAANDSLFQGDLANNNHILSSFLPPKLDNHYYLRKKHHNRELLHKILISSIAISLFVYFTKTVTSTLSHIIMSLTFSSLDIIVISSFLFYMSNCGLSTCFYTNINE